MATSKKNATEVASTNDVDQKKSTGTKVAAKKTADQNKKSSNKETDKPAAAKKAAVKSGSSKDATEKKATAKKTATGTTKEKAAAKAKDVSETDKNKEAPKATKKATAVKEEKPAKKKAASASKKETEAPKTSKAKAAEVEKQENEPNLTEHKAKLKKALKKSKEKTQKAKTAAKKVVIPKTSTEKARKYEPEFTKSVLDQVPEEYEGPSLRYSDNDLVEFRELISRKLESAKKELGYLQGLITRKDQMGGDESENRYMTMEDGSLSMEREQLGQMASRQITFIDHLEKALMRIENKTYGVCRVTGKLIDKARLRAVPHATLSIEAKMGINK